MTDLNRVRQALDEAKIRLGRGEISREDYRQLRQDILEDLGPEDLRSLGVTGETTPGPSQAGSISPRPVAAEPVGPSGGAGHGLRTRVRSLADVDVTPGTVLMGQWRVERELGRGGFGVVVEAEELSLGERQAVKVLDPAMVDRPELLERFRREVRATRKLVHPRIVRVFDYREDLDAGLALFSMEYVQGTSVAGLLARSRERKEPVPVALALAILSQVLEALEAAHAAGVIHRDVTPANILLAGGGPDELLGEPGRDPKVKLADFGISGALERSELSQKSRVLGTAAYVAPEVLDPGADVTTAADVYGAGAVFYELLTQKVPVGRFRDPSQARKGLSKEVDGLTLALLDPDPGQRPAVRDARQVTEACRLASGALELQSAGGPAGARHGERTRPARAEVEPEENGVVVPEVGESPGRAGMSRAAAGVAALAITGVLVGGGVLIQSWRKNQGPGPASGALQAPGTENVPGTASKAELAVTATALPPPEATKTVDPTKKPTPSSLTGRLSDRNPPVGGPLPTGEKPPGLPWMSIAELELLGTIRLQGGWIAQMGGSKGSAFLVKEGTRVLDGEVIEIRPTEVVFRQTRTGASGPEAFREVTKSLRSKGGEKK